jgi:choline-glycine betaine transporter
MEFMFTAGLVGIGLVLFGIGEWFLPRGEESASEEVARVSA